MGLFEFVCGECIRRWSHNTNPGYHVPGRSANQIAVFTSS